MVIFLTACIDPQEMGYTVLLDPDIRLRQYVEALNWYIGNTNYPIVFCENSGVDISGYYKEQIQGGRLEILTFKGNDYDKSFGKGYGEAGIIEYGIENSSIIKSHFNDPIIKITGRFICHNVMILVKKCNFNTVYSIISKDDYGGNVMGAQVVVAPIEFWKNYFLVCKDKLNDSCGYYFEHLLYDRIVQWLKDGFKHREFYTPPLLEGVSGTCGIKISPLYSKKELFKYRIMYILHRFLKYNGYLNPFYKGKSREMEN